MTDTPTRLVIDYGGMQIEDARRELRVVLIGNPPPGLKARLRADGFHKHPDEPATFTRAANPSAIFTAQAIGRDFFPPTKETT